MKHLNQRSSREGETPHTPLKMHHTTNFSGGTLRRIAKRGSKGSHENFRSDGHILTSHVYPNNHIDSGQPQDWQGIGRYRKVHRYYVL